MPETRTVKGFSEVGLPLAEGDFELSPYLIELLTWLQDLNWPGALCVFDRLQKYEDKVSYSRALDTCLKYAKAVKDNVWESNLRMLQVHN